MMIKIIKPDTVPAVRSGQNTVHVHYDPLNKQTNITINCDMITLGVAAHAINHIYQHELENMEDAEAAALIKTTLEREEESWTRSK